MEPLIVNTSETDKVNIRSVFSGEIPAVVIKNFYDKQYCTTVAERIQDFTLDNFQDKNTKCIGPFLMSYLTKKEEYFEKAKKAEKEFDDIFSRVEKPTSLIYALIRHMLPECSVSLASESQYNYSPCVIRVHEKGKIIPVHKDNVKYEGLEYFLSDIDQQISCVLHIQESESGGDLVIYDKQWKKRDEFFRNPDFGYSSSLTSTSPFCRVSNLKPGDLVIINPNYYHRVTKITGETPRITIGMFLGFYKQENRIVAWA